MANDANILTMISLFRIRQPRRDDATQGQATEKQTKEAATDATTLMKKKAADAAKKGGRR